MMERASAIEGVQGAMSIEEPSRRHNNNNNNRRGKSQKEKRNNNLERKTKRIKKTRELCLLSKSEESLRRCIVLRRRNPLDVNDNRWHARTKKKRKTPTTPTMKLATVEQERKKERKNKENREVMNAPRKRKSAAIWIQKSATMKGTERIQASCEDFSQLRSPISSLSLSLSLSL
jgi:hypothetical protein